VSGDLSVLGKASSTPSGLLGDGDVDKLNQLAELHKSDALTDDEFAAAKSRLLGL
jgi:hypothetical protein